MPSPGDDNAGMHAGRSVSIVLPDPVASLFASATVQGA